MMRWNSFGRSVGFAALAAAGAAVWLIGAGPFLGGRGALSLYLIATGAIYTAGLAGSLRAALATGIVVGTSGLGLPFGAAVGNEQEGQQKAHRLLAVLGGAAGSGSARCFLTGRAHRAVGAVTAVDQVVAVAAKQLGVKAQAAVGAAQAAQVL